MTRKIQETRRVNDPPPERPLLVFDGDCGFCRRWVARWRRWTGDRVGYEPYQSARERFPEIPLDQFKRSIQFIRADGTVLTGAEGVFHSLAVNPRLRWLVWLYRFAPGFAAATESGYGFVAGNRPLFSTLMKWFMGSSDEPSSYRLSRWIFMRIIGIIAFAAFFSLWTQIGGLIGENGILPAADFLRSAEAGLGGDRFALLPTLCWVGASDAFLHGLCIAGMGCAVLLVFNIVPPLMLFLVWAIYLSLSVTGQDFLQFQWDTLLLETLFLAIFAAPFRLWSSLRDEAPPSKLAVLLMLWLLFRLMFGSGAVKLASGDETWRGLTALMYHYETQPIPTWTAWFAHQLPEWFQMASAFAMFAVELALPFLMVFRGRLRLAAFFGFVGLQLLILLTGNYGFFNWLALALCLWLVEDVHWRKVIPNRWSSYGFAPADGRGEPAWKRPAVALVALVLVPLGFFNLTGRITRLSPPVWIQPAMAAVQPFRTVNSYGLFAVMTTTRPEIIVEGSVDGESWRPYRFRWKPVELDRLPGFMGPHMPRLDWQMWFAALGNYQGNRWFVQFLAKLLENEPEVTALLASNPFPDRPPVYIRAVLYEYRFTDFGDLAQRGHWWEREAKGLYCPVLKLRESPDTPDL